MAREVTSSSPREIVRDFMTDKFRETGKVEWKIGELEAGLKKTDDSLDRKQISNALLALRAAKKAEQTSQISDSTKPARYWALTARIEAATAPAPESQTEEENPEMTDDRKPRHDSPEHVQHLVEKQFEELSEKLNKQILISFSDMGKQMKTSFVDAVRALADNKPTAVDTTKIEEMLSDFLANSLKESTALAKLGVETATSFAEKHAATVHAISKMIESMADQEEVKEAGFARGFAAGWKAATQKARQEIVEVAKVANEENKKGPERNAAALKFDELLTKLSGRM